MTKSEAWAIVVECRDWNIAQRSNSFIFDGVRNSIDDVYDARRAALTQAWRVIGEQEPTT